jgi:hypothetical protein
VKPTADMLTSRNPCIASTEGEKKWKTKDVQKKRKRKVPKHCNSNETINEKQSKRTHDPKTTEPAVGNEYYTTQRTENRTVDT